MPEARVSTRKSGWCVGIVLESGFAELQTLGNTEIALESEFAQLQAYIAALLPLPASAIGHSRTAAR
ncbi:hypothetical protein [Paenibacillus aestuarii]|uniref:Uncharacterized protein n=1 Tax=Paenibacillus aestuarii TaxID=516965 RepID=A0ABW0K2H3_9BACL|nr:hypothetical protein [Paenibacillus aestuarii]